MYIPIEYDEPLFRPPSEANSLIIQATIGCSWNKCAFCEMYSSKKFRARDEPEVMQEIKKMSKFAPHIRKFFICDGNAFVLSTTRLHAIIERINMEFPKVSRISAYASPRDINAKSLKELKMLQQAGLKLLYIGIESGDNELLKLIKKGESFESTSEALLKAKEAGIKLSVMILNGLGGKKYSRNHAIHSAKISNLIQPEYLSTLVLSFPFGENQYKNRFNGVFQRMNIIELLEEMYMFLDNINLESTIFRSDHASNYLVLKGVLSRDKEELLSKIRFVLQNPEKANLREEWQRGL